MPTAVLEREGKVEITEVEEEEKPKTKPGGDRTPPPGWPPTEIGTIPPEPPEKDKPEKEGGSSE